MQFFDQAIQHCLETGCADVHGARTHLRALAEAGTGGFSGLFQATDGPDISGSSCRTGRAWWRSAASRISQLAHLSSGIPPPPAATSMAMVLDAQLQQAGLFKKVAEAMKDLCKEVNFDCSEKGMQVQSMDSSHVALVSLMPLGRWYPLLGPGSLAMPA